MSLLRMFTWLCPVKRYRCPDCAAERQTPFGPVKVYSKKGLATCGGIHYGHSVFNRQKYPPEWIMPPSFPDNPPIAAYLI
jgi:hypothetical protein